MQHSNHTVDSILPTAADLDYVGDGLVGHRLDIYLPRNGQSSHPVVFLIYGSAWYSNDSKMFGFQSIGMPLLKNGFAVVSINHRSSKEAKFPAQIQDVKAAIRYVRRHAEAYGLDTSFVGITGFSSGGHLSSLVGATNGVKCYACDGVELDLEGALGDCLEESSCVDAVCDWFGPIDLARMENCSSPKGADSPEAELIGGAPDEHLPLLKLLNPMTYLQTTSPKFLVIHGNADPIVPYGQSQFFAEALRQKGLLENFITVEEGKHGPVTFNEETFHAMTEFFKKMQLQK